ncbi:GNAT family N-acetyltransferase [Vibrio gangliei]|uniref:GNAT family N-acetyltransferase n=1 Tax=Vibrio gangliei TaxID=2077090 RepID=UPI000D011EC4|nr:GNAT family N-acetyltransferase [Vibrio gangliei]
MNIQQATINELDQVAHLFDLYRQFYGQQSDLVSSKAFIKARIENSESVIFLALNEKDEALGFIQLYPAFSSVAMKPMWYLNDLFVSESARKQGVARSLLKKAKQHAQETNALTIKLATAVDNHAAQALYESEGYTKVTAFDHFTQRVE